MILMIHDLRTHRRAFTLVEIVISVGIVSLSLLSIFALFGSSLRSASETVSQQEVLGITRSLGDFLRSTSNGIGYQTVLNWVGSSTDPGLYAFIASDGTISIGLKTSTAISTAASSLTARAGRLFRLVPTLSLDVPGITSSNLADQAFIPLQVQIYVVPAIDSSIAGLAPVFTYETSVFR